MDISPDSTFLILACDDNRIHVRALTTGSDIHTLERHPSNSVVTALKFAEDSCRCVIGCGDGKVYVYDVHSSKLTQTLTAHAEMITAILTMPSDRFLATAGGSKIIVWNFSSRQPAADQQLSLGAGSVGAVSATGKENIPSPAPSYQQYSRPVSKRVRRVDNHREPITCVAVSRDGTSAVTGSRDALVKIWTLSTGETHTTLDGHTAAVSCVAFAPNGNFCVSGSDDSTCRVWGLTLGLIVSAFREHQHKIVSVSVSGDSKKILSADVSGVHRLWIADTGVQLIVKMGKPRVSVAMHGNHVFAVGGKNDTSVRFWSIYDHENERGVSHSEPITTYAGENCITTQLTCN